MAMKTACFGYRTAQLARAFGYSLRQVTRIINSDPFREYESALMKKAEDAAQTVFYLTKKAGLTKGCGITGEGHLG